VDHRRIELARKSFGQTALARTPGPSMAMIRVTIPAGSFAERIASTRCLSSGGNIAKTLRVSVSARFRLRFGRRFGWRFRRRGLVRHDGEGARNDAETAAVDNSDIHHIVRETIGCAPSKQSREFIP
jgi:hypothetical protein